jgi:hypothetical protein
MKYYWWFIIVTAFYGNSLASMVINGFNEGVKIGSEATQVLTNIAGKSLGTIMTRAQHFC